MRKSFLCRKAFHYAVIMLWPKNRKKGTYTASFFLLVLICLFVPISCYVWFFWSTLWPLKPENWSCLVLQQRHLHGPLLPLFESLSLSLCLCCYWIFVLFFFFFFLLLCAAKAKGTTQHCWKNKVNRTTWFQSRRSHPFKAQPPHLLTWFSVGPYHLTFTWLVVTRLGF